MVIGQMLYLDTGITVPKTDLRRTIKFPLFCVWFSSLLALLGLLSNKKGNSYEPTAR
jgi:hypothetical protein